jgi:pantoate--beta-alanine ligase
LSCRTVRTVDEARSFLEGRRADGARVGVVPTMGALHEGHLALVREAKRLSDEVVVTIFVNPTQFGPGEDYERYPRDLAADTQLATSAGATLIFAPTVAEMYPPGEQTRVVVEGFSQGMCGSSRPGHFVGVATVVTKLFHIVGPGKYFFGQKDYQQWRLIERMARDLAFPVQVIGCATVREEDGLAMSSRNAYLEPNDRARAAQIPRALQSVIDAFRDGERDSDVLRTMVEEVLKGDFSIDYVETRHPETWEVVSGVFEPPLLLGVAARLPGARLIDNVVLSSNTSDVVEEPR